MKTKKIFRAAIFLASFAAAAQAEPCCQPRPLSDADLDGDGIVDAIHRSSDSGSAMATTSVDLVLSRTGKRIEIVLDYSYSEMVGAEDVPAELLAPGMERALEAVEVALFGCVCQEPDPSLAWLLESGKGPRSLRWVTGSPSLPDSYTLREKGATRWLSYGGGAHRGLTRKMTEPEIERLGADPRTGYVLARTAHGVLLIDEKGSRHAWLYVTRDGEGQKLRFPTVVAGRLEEGRAVIRLSHEQAFYGTYGCGLLRIDLRDGSYSERWREKTDAGMEKCWAELEKAFVMECFDAFGNHCHQTTVGWQGNKLIYSGQSTGSGPAVPVRDTFTKTGDANLEHTGEIQMEGKWVMTDHETCTRVRK